MKRTAILLSICLALSAVFAYAQDEGFQTATVVAFERAANDAQHPEKADNYKISMRIGDIIYNCHANAPVTVFNDWTINKQFPARVSPNGKIMEVKNFDGQMVELNITGKKKPK
jgi:hypothetical protein